MASTELPWRFWRRRVRPVAAGIALLMILLAGFRLSLGADSGEVRFTGWAALAVTSTEVASAACLVGGWLWRSDRAMTVGLSLAAAVFTARGVLLMQDRGPLYLPVWINLIIGLVICGGSWLLEIAAAREEPSR